MGKKTPAKRTRRFSETRAFERIVETQLKRVVESEGTSEDRRAAAKDVKRITDSALKPGKSAADPEDDGDDDEEAAD